MLISLLPVWKVEEKYIYGIAGYALIAEEVANATPENPVTLKQFEYNPADEASDKLVVAGTDCRIMTVVLVSPAVTGVVRLVDTVVSHREQVIGI